METQCDQADPLWSHDCVSTSRSWSRAPEEGRESLSDMFSATGHRDCSFRRLTVLFWDPEAGHHAKEGMTEQEQHKAGIINQVVTWHMARGSLATWTHQLSAIRTQAAFNYRSSWRGQWCGGSQTADGSPKPASGPFEWFVYAYTQFLPLIMVHLKQK